MHPLPDPPRRSARRRRRLAASVAASVAAACAVTGGNAWAATPGTTPPAAGTTSRVTAVSTVTLVTGDRVRLSTRSDGTQDAALLPDPSDPRPSASVYRNGKDLYVVPLEALPYLRAGKLDRALFDVTQLVASGMADEKAGNLKLMVSAPSSPLTTATTATAKSAKATTAKASTAPPAPPDSTTTVTVPSLGLTGVRVDKHRARAFWQGIDTAPAASGGKAPAFGAGVGKLWLDRKVKVTLDRSVPQIGAPAAYAAGLTGAGVKVAVVDTGIDNDNADVSPKVVAEKNFTAEDSTDDLFGHGTHVASIVAGSGKNSGGKYKGVAPGAELIDARVLDSTGSGDDTSVLAGMTWAAEQGAQVINMSLGAGPTDGTDPMALAVNELTKQYGTLFVIAAGNSGADETVSSPGTADAALTVGAVDRSDVLADFSSRGPRRGDGAIKPEITAPGVGIVAAQADGTQLGTVVAPGYVALSGTSMATPHVAGSAALLKQQHPGWTPAQLKSDLVSTAKPTAATPIWSQGVGRVDVASAIATAGLAVDQGTLNLGFNAWPHGNHPVQTRTVTYTNSGSAATTLTLAAALTGDQGQALPAGVLSLTPTTLPLAAGASGTVTVTVDPNKAGVGRWGGLLTATSTGGIVLRTAAGFTNEAERYDVTVTVLDRQGKPTTNADITLFNPQTGEFHSSWDLTDPTKPTFRISPGTWFAAGMILPDQAATTTFETTLAVQPEFTVSGARAITLDASTARPVALSVADRDVTSTLSQVSVLRTGDGGMGGTGMAAMGGGMTFYATPTAKVATGGLIFGAADSLRVPAIAATVASSGRVLHPELMSDDSRLDGTRTLPVAKASGNVKGGLALLAVSAVGPIDAELARLAKAGATAVAVYPATPDAAGWLDAAAGLPTVALPQADGEALAALLAKGAVKVTLVGTYYSPKVYDVAHEWSGQIPARATIRYGAGDLGRIDETYRDSGTQAPLQEAVAPGLTGGSWAMFIPTRPGSTRAAYVSTQLPVSPVLFYGAVPDPQYGYANPLLEWDGDAVRYQAGQRAAVTWTPQVAKPGLPATDPYGLTGRSGDDAFAYLSPWTDGAGRVSWPMGTDAGAWTLSAGGSTIASGTGPVMSATLPAKRQRYTLAFTDRIDDPQWNRSTSTSTQWTFTSAHTEPGPQSQLQPQLALLSVDLPLPLDSTNSAQAGSTMPFQVTGRFPAGVAAAKVSAVTFEISADGGKSWTSGKVKRVDADTFGVTITNPRSKGPVSVRISATAQDGAGVRQEVTAAYVLK